MTIRPAAVVIWKLCSLNAEHAVHHPQREIERAHYRRRPAEGAAARIQFDPVRQQRLR